MARKTLERVQSASLLVELGAGSDIERCAASARKSAEVCVLDVGVVCALPVAVALCAIICDT